VATQIPVTLAHGAETVTVSPGDVVCADGSGAVAIARDRVGEVAEAVREIVAMERLVAADAARGVSLREARARHGYNRFARRLEG
jgi:regulator of RNase E activity RraA